MGVESPIILVGTNLKERHRYLNNLVQQVFKENVHFEDILKLPEHSPIDRVFKIDLASKYKNVDFILQNLKDDFMLYVSKSLKCLWLLDPQYRYIVNPANLETKLYPEMIQPAKNKMKNWLPLHLNDKERCRDFYNYYKYDFEYAIKFLWRCSNDFILGELPSIADKFSPKQLQMLFETCPEACKLYFDILPNNIPARTNYVNNEYEYFKNTKYLLKWNVNVYLDIVEKYYNKNVSERFNSKTTQYVFKHCRSRIFAKIELYASCLLHMASLAAKLNSEESKSLVLQLARASYLQDWFTYKAVEPLIKRISIQERALFKKKVFVEKDIGSKIEEWPYETPVPLQIEIVEKNDLLSDVEPRILGSFRKMLRKRKCSRIGLKCDAMVCMQKTQLDLLFNKYRFTGFERAFVDLKSKLLTESTIQARLNIMLVLVSKSGGIPENTEKLLNYLVHKHINEPTNLRVSVIRSLVNRLCVWRLHDTAWGLLLQFGRGLGLDGLVAEQLCQEGLHCVVIRHLLANTPLPEKILVGFLREYSTLTEYKLTKDEKSIIAKRLPPLFIPSNPHGFINALTHYKMNIEDFPEAKPELIKLAQADSSLISRLYTLGFLRRELFREMFTSEQTEAAYINVLRHDVSPLENGKTFASLIQEKDGLKFDKFLHSVSVYFGEPGGLAELHILCLEDYLKTHMKPKCVRPICVLLSDQLLLSRLKNENEEHASQMTDNVKKRVTAAFRANAQKTYPPLNIDELDWQWLGYKAVANKVLICRKKDRKMYLEKLLQSPRTAKISFRLAHGTEHDVETFIKMSSIRPIPSLKLAVSTFMLQKEVDLRVWSAIKSIIENVNLSKKFGLLTKLSYLPSLPSNIEADYRIALFRACRKVGSPDTLHNLNKLKNILQKVDKTFVYNIATEFIKNRLKSEMCTVEINDVELEHIFIMSKFLLLCESEDSQTLALDTICGPFFDEVQSSLQTEKKNYTSQVYLELFVFSLKYTKAFLSNKYVNPFPVFEAVLKRLRQIWPTQKYFGKYAEIHLTMLYYKTIKQALKMHPDIFDDGKKVKECIETVGTLFGKYIGFEIKELVSKYFESIINMYMLVLNKYLNDYFKYGQYDSKCLFVTFIIKGILEAKTSEATILAGYVFENYHNLIDKTHKEEILKVFEESDDGQVKNLLYADIYPAVLYKSC